MMFLIGTRAPAHPSLQSGWPISSPSHLERLQRSRTFTWRRNRRCSRRNFLRRRVHVQGPRRERFKRCGIRQRGRRERHPHALGDLQTTATPNFLAAAGESPPLAACGHRQRPAARKVQCRHSTAAARTASATTSSAPTNDASPVAPSQNEHGFARPPRHPLQDAPVAFALLAPSALCRFPARTAPHPVRRTSACRSSGVVPKHKGYRPPRGLPQATPSRRSMSCMSCTRCRHCGDSRIRCAAMCNTL